MEVENKAPIDNESSLNTRSGNHVILNETFLNPNPEQSTNEENNENLETIENPLIQQGNLTF